MTRNALIHLTGMVLSAKNFDMHGDGQAGKNLRDYINGAPQNTIIAIASQDEASPNFYFLAINALKSIGGTKFYFAYRSPYILLGFYGYQKVSWISEAYNASGTSSMIRTRIQLLPGIKYLCRYQILSKGKWSRCRSG